MLSTTTSYRKCVTQSEPLHDIPNIAQVERLIEERRTAAAVNVHPRLESVEKQNIPTQALEAKEVLQEDPSMSTVPRLLGQ
jgi:hypothetical protein